MFGIATPVLSAYRFPEPLGFITVNVATTADTPDTPDGNAPTPTTGTLRHVFAANGVVYGPAYGDTVRNTRDCRATNNPPVPVTGDATARPAPAEATNATTCASDTTSAKTTATITARRTRETDKSTGPALPQPRRPETWRTDARR